MNSEHIPSILILGADLVADGEVQVGAPIDATECLYLAWGGRTGVGQRLHPYLRKAGVYVICDENAVVIYIGCTTHRFDRYLKVKLAVRDVGDDLIRPTPANYWERNVRTLDRGAQEVQKALTRLSERRFRIWLLPVEYVGPIDAEKRRSVQALEAKLLRRHAMSEGRKPVLNYEGASASPDRGNGCSRRGLAKMSSFLRRRGSPAAAGARTDGTAFSNTARASYYD